MYKEFGIYRITNIINGKTYVGKTGVSFGDRWDCHKAKLKSNSHDNKHLQRAWNKYGCDNFEFSILEIVSERNALDALERKYIQQYRNINKCYNILDGGDGGFVLGSHLSDEAKRSIAEKNRQNMTGKKLSPETRKKMSLAHKKRYAAWTVEERLEHGRKTSKYASGYHWSKESKEAFSKLQQTRPNGATLNLNTVYEIRRLYEQDGKTVSEISDELNIPRHNVYMIATYRRWKNA